MWIFSTSYQSYLLLSTVLLFRRSWLGVFFLSLSASSVLHVHFSMSSPLTNPMTERKLKVLRRNSAQSSVVDTEECSLWRLTSRVVKPCVIESIYYRKRGSASYIVREVFSVRERERDTEKDGSDVTIVALKLAMSLHFPLPKIRTNGDEFTLSLAKNSHFLFLPSHFPSLPS